MSEPDGAERYDREAAKAEYEEFELVTACATAPHTFIPLGRFGFTRPVTVLSKAAASVLNLPLRVYVVLRKTPKP